MDKYYDALPDRPFTGSRALDDEWYDRMTPGEKAEYEKAVKEREDLANQYFQLSQFIEQSSSRR
jgi:hypothetical protein